MVIETRTYSVGGSKKIAEGVLIRSNIGGGMGGGSIKYFGEIVNEDAEFIYLKLQDSQVNIGKANIVDVRPSQLWKLGVNAGAFSYFAFPKEAEIKLVDAVSNIGNNGINVLFTNI